MKLLLDNNLSFRIATALHALFEEHEIIALRDKFPSGVSDEEWIGELSREGSWAVLTRDLRLRTRPHERRAMDNSRIVFFFLGRVWNSYPVTEMAARLIRLLPKMAHQTELVERGRFELPINAGSKLKPHRD